MPKDNGSRHSARLPNRPLLEPRLEEEVLALENELDKRNVSDKVKENIQTELRIKKQQIEEIIAYETQVAILRSKVKWYNEGEKNTKHFHKLEKRHFNSTFKAQMGRSFRRT